jgi:hypothetical protein
MTFRPDSRSATGDDILTVIKDSSHDQGDARSSIPAHSLGVVSTSDDITVISNHSSYDSTQEVLDLAAAHVANLIAITGLQSSLEAVYLCLGPRVGAIAVGSIRPTKK